MTPAQLAQVGAVPIPADTPADAVLIVMDGAAWLAPLALTRETLAECGATRTLELLESHPPLGSRWFIFLGADNVLSTGIRGHLGHVGLA